MDSGSTISIFLLLAEISIALGVVLVLIIKKLRRSRWENRNLNRMLKDERSPKRFREKLKDYFEQEIGRTNKHHSELENSEEDKDKRHLALWSTRQSILNIEKKSALKNPLDTDYWPMLDQAYTKALKIPEEKKDVEEAEPEQKEAEAGVRIEEISLNSVTGEELGRLRNVINNQYQSIDVLKQQLLGLSNDADLKDNPKIAELQTQLNLLQSEQEQMAMCVRVLEAENERLTHALEQLEMNPALDEPEEEQAEEPKGQESETLIKDLLRTNKEQSQCIATLESELEEFRNAEDADSGQLLSLQREINELKLENQNYIDAQKALEMELKEFRQQASSSAGAAPSAVHKELEKQIHAKNAELELLREEYQSMHEKYIKLYQDKAS